MTEWMIKWSNLYSTRETRGSRTGSTDGHSYFVHTTTTRKSQLGLTLEVSRAGYKFENTLIHSCIHSESIGMHRRESYGESCCDASKCMDFLLQFTYIALNNSRSFFGTSKNDGRELQNVSMQKAFHIKMIIIQRDLKLCLFN